MSTESTTPAAEEPHEQYLDRSHITKWERLGYVSGVLLLISLWLPWFSTNADNPASVITSAPGVKPGDSVNAWEVFGPVLPWAFVLLAIAPAILTWIVARNHTLTWPPGEVTMLAGLTGVVLVLCNGIILGKPQPRIDVSLAIGWFLALLACMLISYAGFRRQAMRATVGKPPGTI